MEEGGATFALGAAQMNALTARSPWVVEGCANQSPTVYETLVLPGAVGKCLPMSALPVPRP
jgi:hypothetical protein